MIERVCLWVFLSVCEHIFGAIEHVPVTVARSFSGGVAISYELPVLWMMSYFPRMAACCSGSTGSSITATSRVG